MSELATLGPRELPKLSGAELLGLDRTVFETGPLSTKAPRAIEAAPRPAEESRPESSALDRAREAIARAEATVKYTGPATAKPEPSAVQAEKPAGRSLEGGRRGGMDRADIIALSFIPGQTVRLGREDRGWSITNIDNAENKVTIHRNLPNADGTPGKTFETHTMTPRELAMRNFNALDEKP